MTLGAAVFGEGPRPLDSLEAITLSPGSLASAAGQPSVWIVDPATERGLCAADHDRAL